jgi:hypothetical protein
MNRIIILLAMGAVLAGCKSPEAANSGSMAAVEISGHSGVAVREMARAVMRANNYAEAAVQDFDMVFERPASKRDTAAFGSLAHGAVWERVKMRIRQRPSGPIMLACDAFIVENKGEGMFETERRLAVMRQARYQDMLNEVKTRLDTANPSQ